MNKQERENKKNTYNNLNIYSLLSIHFIYKSSKSVRDKYELNTHAVTILVASFLYGKFIDPLFTIGAIYKFLNVYQFNRVKKYFIILNGIGLITQRGVNKYSLTDSGIQAIQEISHNSESLIYEFCSKYNLEL